MWYLGQTCVIRNNTSDDLVAEAQYTTKNKNNEVTADLLSKSINTNDMHVSTAGGADLHLPSFPNHVRVTQ